jgi:hypothetical protein
MLELDNIENVLGLDRPTEAAPTQMVGYGVTPPEKPKDAV